MHNTLAAVAMAATLAAGAASAAPVNINFANVGTHTAPSLTFGDVTLTGSDDVHILNLNGLGIGNSVVNNGEWITFTFSSLVNNVSLLVGLAGGGSAAAPAGLRTVEVFDGLGNLLGSQDQVLTGTFDISAIVGGESFLSFTMTASPTTSFRIAGLSYEVAPIPLPAGAPLLLGALAALALLRRRSAKSA